MSCPVCGKRQTGRCEGGGVSYVAGVFPCYQNPDQFAPRLTNPDQLSPRQFVPAVVGSAAGLEDLL